MPWCRMGRHIHAVSRICQRRHQNASEVLREGNPPAVQQEDRESVKIKALRAAAKRGWDDIAAGRYVDLEDDGDLDDLLNQLDAQALIEAVRRTDAAESSTTPWN